ncbi:MAG: hypothetical protein Q3962_08745 [Corynebacterium sp.]|nr:hypothetical protein [Corynebacterium sp.]
MKKLLAALMLVALPLGACTKQNATTWNVSEIYTSPATAMPDAMNGSTIFLISGKNMVAQDICGGLQAKVKVTNDQGKTVDLKDASSTKLSFSDATAQDANCDGQNLYVHLKMVSLVSGDYDVTHQPSTNGYTIVTLTRQANSDDPTSKEGFQLICG